MKRLPLLSVLLLTLAACASGPSPVLQKEAVFSSKATPTAASSNAATATANGATSGAATSAATETKPQQTISPSDLTGLNPKNVQAILGEPSFVRRDASVQIMLYETSDCVLEIIFFEPTPNEHFNATHITARTRAGSPSDTQSCLSSVVTSSASTQQTP